jgi:hypothetical protein
MQKRRFATAVLSLAVASAGAAPAAQAHHAPGEGTVAPQAPTRIITVSQPRGFDFGSASIGAGGAIGVVLVAGGSAVLVRRNRTRKTAEV